MASRNVNKIKPWMLAKNTNEIVNSYVQNIYKQMPMSFNKGLKSCKVATGRPENRGPLSTWKNQQKQLPSHSITPRSEMAKKTIKLTQHTNNVMNFFKNSKSNHHLSANSPTGNLAPIKRTLKTPNYKIYKSLRYGSSCSSSRSTIFKRYDERKRQRQSNLAQINYLVRSFHTGKFEPTYARFLMPARNQQLETNLGSIPDALKFSNNMVKDLMTVNKATKDKISQQPKDVPSTPPLKRVGLEIWNHPPSISKFKLKTSREGGAFKGARTMAERKKIDTTTSPENRSYAHLNVGHASQIKNAKLANELFTPQHDRQKTELHEKHRRNRMKKLGLIKSSEDSERLMDENDMSATEKLVSKKVPRLGNQAESKYMPPLLIENNNVLEDKPYNSNPPKTKKDIYNRTAEIKSMAHAKETLKTVRNSGIPLATKSNAMKAPSGKFNNYINYSTTSPIVALRAQMPNKADLGLYRYNRHDFFSTKKY